VTSELLDMMFGLPHVERLRRAASPRSSRAARRRDLEGVVMMTRTQAQENALRAVFGDRGRSIESIVERGIDAGIALERERFRAILELAIPPGIERAVSVMALAGCSPAEIAAFVATLEKVSDEDARARRQAFRLVNVEEAQHAVV